MSEMGKGGLRAKPLENINTFRKSTVQRDLPWPTRREMGGVFCTPIYFSSSRRTYS